MKQLLALTLLLIVALMLLCLCGCRSKKEVTDYHANEVSMSSSSRTARMSATCGITTTTVTVDYRPVIDPLTGEIRNLPVREQTVTTHASQSVTHDEVQQSKDETSLRVQYSAKKVRRSIQTIPVLLVLVIIISGIVFFYRKPILAIFKPLFK